MLTDAAAALSMNDIYRYQRYIYDVTRRYFLLGRLHLIENLSPPDRAHILEVGCGTAWNLVRTARAYPGARLYGLDISSQMLGTAARSIDHEGLRHRVSLARGDATQFDAERLFAREKFDRVFVSYALSMIPGWRKALEACEAALANGGEIHIVDFGRCEGFPAFFRRALYAWLGHFSVTPCSPLDRELEGFAQAKGLELKVARLYRGYAQYAVLRRV